MTRVVVISDIHGNIAALEAIVARLPKLAPDQVAILGDHALFGPKPTETIDLVRKLQKGGALVTAGTADIGVADLDYAAVVGLSNELREKLARVRPDDIGQAARISGMTPAAISLLLIHVKKRSRRSA